MIYLDHAATSFPKPPEVISSVCGCLQNCAGNAGRGGYRSSMQVSELLYDCRVEAAKVFGADSPERVVFTAGATAAINQAVRGSVRPGDHVLISDLEHNAVYRPVWKLAKEGVITYSVFPTFAGNPAATAERILRGIEERIRPNTKLLVCAHASNVCSAVLPAAKIGALCRRRGIRFVLDAAQSAGHLPVDLGAFSANAICIPGHKGLCGPQGVGLLILEKDTVLEPLLQGGSGVGSLDPEMPETPPERYEAGTLPLPAIAGLRAALKLLNRQSFAAARMREKRLWEALAEELREIPGITVAAPQFSGSVLSFWSDRVGSEALAAAFDARGICVRAGFHCAALAHKTLGTPPGGAVRVSFGKGNSREEVRLFANALREILSQA